MEIKRRAPDVVFVTGKERGVEARDGGARYIGITSRLRNWSATPSTRRSPWYCVSTVAAIDVSGYPHAGEAWATHGKRPYTPARYEAVPSQPDAAELGRLEGAFHRSLRPGAQLTTSLLGTSGLPTPVGACVEINQ